MTKEVEKHERVNDILLGFIERPILKWLTAHMPAWVGPDLLTGIGVFASLLILASYALVPINRNFFWLASFGFVLNWFGDSMDGSLARYRHIERPRYGFFVDHSVDAFSVVVIFVGFVLSGYVNVAVGLLGAIAYLMVMILVYLKTYVTGIFEITGAKVGPTEIRFMVVVVNTIMVFIKTPFFIMPVLGRTTVLGIAMLIMVVLLFGYFLVKTLIEARRLALLDGRRLERRLTREKRQLEKEAKQETGLPGLEKKDHKEPQ